jgi:hypothetical protein
MTSSDVQLKQYRILRKLGAGGMAEVFLAEKTGLAGFSRPVAIKTILASGASEEAVQLFLDEARVASGLSHSAIVQTLDLGYENETLFIVMEYVAGPPLSRLIWELRRLERRLSPSIVAYVGARIAGALDYAHRKARTADGQPLSMVHRDVSPQNVLLTRDGTVKLTDFGVARASVQSHRTKTGQVRGKAAYMAPEQVRAKPLDGRTDQFALALVLYEALTGVRAFQRKSDLDSMRAVLKEPVRPIHELNPEVPDSLVAVLDRALEKKPDARWASCEVFEAELRGTWAHKNEAAILQEIAALMDEAFGQQEWASVGPAVEAWHPTVTIGKDGKVSAPKLDRIGGHISADVAALLGRVGPGGEGGSDEAPRLPIDAATGTPMAVPASAAYEAARSSATGAGLESSGGVPLTGGYADVRIASGAWTPSDPRLFATGSGALLAESSIGLERPRPRPAWLSAVIAVGLLGLGAGLLALVQALLDPGPEIRTSARLEEGPAVVAPRATPAPRVVAPPTPPKPAASPSPPDAPALAPTADAAPRAPTPPRSSRPSRPRRVAAPPTPTPDPPPAPAPAPPTAESLKARAAALRRAAIEAGRPELADRLKPILVDLALGKVSKDQARTLDAVAAELGR